MADHKLKQRSYKIVEHLKQYAYLMRLDKPIGSLLLLWPTLWGLFLANDGAPTQRLIIIFILGVFVMRSAGCVMNDLADRNFDPHVERTRTRPLAAKKIHLIEAFIILFILLSIALFLALFLNTKSIILAVIAAAIAASYPFMKRFHSMPQLHLGIAFGFGIPIAYAASINQLPFDAWYLLGMNIIWTLIYDTVYALCDQEDDRKIGVKSSALLLNKLLGEREYIGIFILQLIMLILLMGLGIMHAWSIIWYLICIIIACIFIKHLFLIKQRNKESLFQVFLDNNRVGWIILLGILFSLFPQ